MATRLTALQRREQIVTVATGLFARQGYQKMTTRLLAESCGVSEAALYRYFPSKSALYTAVLKSVKDRLDIGRLMAELKDMDEIEDILQGMAHFIISTHSKNTALSRLLLFSALEQHPLARETFQNLRGPFVAFLTRKLRQLQRTGKIRDVHPEITARCFVGMVMDCSLSMHLWKKLQGKSYVPEQVIANNIPIFVAGLRQHQQIHTSTSRTNTEHKRRREGDT
jgi:AcrR family transcriptional regulator